MQITVNSIFDSSLDNRSGARVAKGIRQVCYFFLLRSSFKFSNEFYFKLKGY